jgi:hypothetical protein
MISFIKRKIVNIYSCSFLALTVLFFSLQSCQKQPINPKFNYSGKELFEGIYFGTGRVGEKLTILHGMRIKDLVEDETAIARVSMHNQKILATINSTNPGFLNEFKNRIETKSPTEIATALEIGYNEMTRAIVILNGGNNPPDIDTADLDNLWKNAQTPEEARQIFKIYLEDALGNKTNNGNGGVNPQKNTCWAILVLIGWVLVIIREWGWYITKWGPDYTDRIVPVGFYNESPDLFQEQLILQITNL